MKTFGSVSEYHHERARDLLRAYFRCIAVCDHISMPDVFRSVAASPATRFWVSAPRAAVVVAKILRGDKLLWMRPNKREMFFEIYRRFLVLRRANPHWTVPHLVGEVVAQPAPCFYLAPGSARVLILKARKQWFEEKSRRLRGC